MRLYTEVVPDSLVAHTRLPRAMVDTTLRRLREAGRIPKGFRHAPPFDAGDIARILLGLSAMSATAAVDQERQVGALRLADGQGEATAEREMIAIVEAATGASTIDNDVDTIRIGQTVASLEITARATLRNRRSNLVLARYGEEPPAAAAFFEIPVAAVFAIARELLNQENFDD
ncbi:hypothetical protein NKI32_07825 [Mesorhizobium sp. M0761]|uniref:hypothetical protein n=1 Tax=Mesorhizobium sp. M0761 TaxID=2956994 RepID=UPI00333A7C47